MSTVAVRFIGGPADGDLRTVAEDFVKRPPFAIHVATLSRPDWPVEVTSPANGPADTLDVGRSRYLFARSGGDWFAVHDGGDRTARAVLKASKARMSDLDAMQEDAAAWLVSRTVEELGKTGVLFETVRISTDRNLEFGGYDVTVTGIAVETGTGASHV